MMWLMSSALLRSVSFSLVQFADAVTPSTYMIAVLAVVLKGMQLLKRYMIDELHEIKAAIKPQIMRKMKRRWLRGLRLAHLPLPSILPFGWASWPRWRASVQALAAARRAACLSGWIRLFRLPRVIALVCGPDALCGTAATAWFHVVE